MDKRKPNTVSGFKKPCYNNGRSNNDIQNKNVATEMPLKSTTNRIISDGEQDRLMLLKE